MRPMTAAALAVWAIVGAIVAIGVMIPDREDREAKGADPAPPRPKQMFVGDQGTVSVEALGCLSRADADEFLKLLYEDELAARKFMDERISAGACKVLPDGTRVVAADWSMLSDARCFRPVGEPKCLWINKGRVKADEAPGKEGREGGNDRPSRQPEPTPQAAPADACGGLVARLIAATGATLAETTDEWRHLYHPLAGGHPLLSKNALSLKCGAHPMIGVDSYGRAPSQAFLTFAGRAGAIVTPDTAALVSGMLSRCYEQFVERIKAGDEPRFYIHVFDARTHVACRVFQDQYAESRFAIAETEPGERELSERLDREDEAIKRKGTRP